MSNVERDLPAVDRGVAEVGQPGEAAARREQVVLAVGDEETDGILRVVRHRERAG